MLNKNDSKNSIILCNKKSGNRNNNWHLIKGVPFVSQEKNFYCHYACLAMIFQYYGINTDLREILYNSGVGYSLIYPHPSSKYFPVGGYAISQWFDDQQFLSSIYGLSYERWKIEDSKRSEEERWFEYWRRVKQYIQNDIPVKTTVNQFYLPSTWRPLKKISYLSVKIVDIMPEWIWNFIPSSIHDIVILGYNESNETIWYNDPASGIWSTPEDGTYTKMNLDNLRKAIKTAKVGKTIPKYSIEIFKKNGVPLSKEEAFQRVHDRNINRMSGSSIAYDKRYRHYTLGVKALNKLKNDFDRSKINYFLSRYKHTGFKLNLYNKIRASYFKKYIFYHPNLLIANVYHDIAIEKQNAVEYLDNNANILKKYQNEKKLLVEEAEKWKELSLYFSKFIKKNIFIKKSEAYKIIKNMNKTLSDVISIENRIIKGNLKYKKK